MGFERYDYGGLKLETSANPVETCYPKFVLPRGS